MRKSQRWLVIFLGLAGLLGGLWAWQRSAPSLVQQADSALAAKDWPRVERLVAQLQKAKQIPVADRVLAESLYLQGLPQQAIPLLQQIPESSPEYARAVVILGRCYLLLKQYAAAFEHLNKALELNPDAVEAHRGLAVIAYDLGQMAAAVDHLQRVAALDPTDGKPHRLIGLIEKDLSFLEKAQASYEEALRRQLPKEFREQVYTELAEVLIERLNFREALQTLDRRRQDFSESEDTLVIRVQAHRGLNDLQQADELVDSSLKQFPNSGRLYLLAGQLAFDRNDLTRAATALETSVRLLPTDEVAHYLLAQVYSAMNRPKEAAEVQKIVDQLRADLQKLTDLNREAILKPWDRAVRLELANTCDRLKRPELAKMWRQAAEYCPEIPPITNPAPTKD